ncbi:MAG: hypothetical protein P8Z37_14340 [Acidobacteriota bacterium]
MKYTRLTILSGVLASTLVVGCMLASAQSKWEVVIPQSNFGANLGAKLRATAFHDENFGVTGGAGDAGKAAVSTDGGKTWTQAASSGS